MQNLRIKHELQRVRQYDIRINAKLEQVLRLRAKLTGRVSRLSGMPSGGGADWTDIIARISELEREIDAEIDELTQARGEILGAITLLPDERMRTIVELRYVSMYSWTRISQVMHYDISTIFKLHAHALRVFATRKLL